MTEGHIWRWKECILRDVSKERRCAGLMGPDTWRPLTGLPQRKGEMSSFKIASVKWPSVPFLSPCLPHPGSPLLSLVKCHSALATLNDPVGTVASGQEAISTLSSPLCAAGSVWQLGRRGGQGVHSRGTKYRFCTKSVYFTCQPPRPLLSLRADGDNETLTNPCILPLIWSSSDESRCFSFVLTTLPDLNFITNCGYHLSSFPLVIWLFYTVQRKCLVG